MRTQEILLKKRDGSELSHEEIGHWIRGYVSGEIKDYHVASWLMAVYFQGMTAAETASLTEAMLRSGHVFPRDRTQNEVWIDKHSTGGVGDKTSMLLVPWVTAAWRALGMKSELKIPMMSGRGLGFTGGTLDKLEAVDGFQTRIPLQRSIELLKQNGFVMMGQTDEMAPADRLMYSLRDVTGTVECIPLIVSSILSKKLAESIDCLVLDVKHGPGSMMGTLERSRELARTLIDVATLNGVKTKAVITSMTEPLGIAVGHLLEMRECLRFLEGTMREAGLLEVTRTLAFVMLEEATRGSIEKAKLLSTLDDVLESDQPLAHFRTMLEAQGGDWKKFTEACWSLEKKIGVAEYIADDDGIIEHVDPKEIAYVVGSLGGSRAKKEDPIDFLVGVELLKKVGDRVVKGQCIARAFCRKSEQKETAVNQLKKAIRIGARAVNATRWIEQVME